MDDLFADHLCKNCVIKGIILREVGLQIIQMLKIT
jgi:hypothetical protein